METVNSLDATLYVLLSLLLGYSLIHTNLLRRGEENVIFKYVMYVGMPALAFTSLSKVQLDMGFLRASLSYALSMALISLSIFLLSKVLGWGRERAYLLILIANFGNTGFFGIPFVSLAFGQGKPLQLSIFLWVLTFLFASFVCIPMLESLRGGSSAIRALRNPLLISVALGLSASILRLSLPQPISLFLDSLASTASPLALISIGASIPGLSSIRKSKISLFLLKTFISPALSMIIGLILRLEIIELSVLVIMSAMPVAIFLGVFSNEYEFYKEEVVAQIALTSISAPIYLNLWLYLLSAL